METLEFAIELRTKEEEKDNVMENLYTMSQIREAISRSQMFFKIGVEISQEFHKKNPVLESLLNKVAGLKRSATLFKRDSSTGVFL